MNNVHALRFSVNYVINYESPCSILSLYKPACSTTFLSHLSARRTGAADSSATLDAAEAGGLAGSKKAAMVEVTAEQLEDDGVTGSYGTEVIGPASTGG